MTVAVILPLIVIATTSAQSKAEAVTVPVQGVYIPVRDMHLQATVTGRGVRLHWQPYTGTTRVFYTVLRSRPVAPDPTNPGERKAIDGIACRPRINGLGDRLPGLHGAARRHPPAHLLRPAAQGREVDLPGDGLRELGRLPVAGRRADVEQPCHRHHHGMRRLHPRLVDATALAALLAATGVLFARNLDTASSSDEGVYLASLDALRHGDRLGSEVFASQPPGFYLVLRLIGLFAGHSLEAARIGFLLVALVGCAGAYALGRALGGVAAGVAAAGLIAILPPFPSEAMRVDADVPAVSITLVALALVAWSTRLDAPRWLAVLGGAVLAFAIFVKLDAIVGVVPVAALLLTAPALRRRLAGYVAAGAAVVAAAFLIAYAGVLDDLWASVVTFHRDARSYPTPQSFRYLVRHEVLALDTPAPWLVLAGAHHRIRPQSPGLAALDLAARRRAAPLVAEAAVRASPAAPVRGARRRRRRLVRAASPLGRRRGPLAAIAVGVVQQFHRIGAAVTDDPEEFAWGSDQTAPLPGAGRERPGASWPSTPGAGSPGRSSTPRTCGSRLGR